MRKNNLKLNPDETEMRLENRKVESAQKEQIHNLAVFPDARLSVDLQVVIVARSVFAQPVTFLNDQTWQ